MTNKVQTDQDYSEKSVSKSAWIQLTIAVSFEIAGAIGLRLSQGFSLILPTLMALISFAIALFLVSRVMKILPVSVAYPVWAGGGTVGVSILGIFLFDEGVGVHKITGIILVTLGVVIINRVSEKKSGC